MRLGIESVGTKHSGGAQILQAVLRTLCDDKRFNSVIVFCSPTDVRQFALAVHAKLTLVERPDEENSYRKRLVWYHRGIARTCQNLDLELVLCLNGMGLGRSAVPTIVMIQQALPFSSESLKTLSLGQQVQLRIIRQVMKSSCRSAERVIVQSNTMRKCVKGYFSVPPSRIGVCYPVPESLPACGNGTTRDLMRQTAPGHRLLYVGNTAPYKNVSRIAGAIRTISDRVPGAAIYCTVDREHPLAQLEGVQPLGYLNRAELREAYQECDVVVQPSLVESGPLVPGEAMEMGRPLLVADRPWARDSCQDAAVYFDPLSDADFVDKAIRLLQDSQLREQIVENGHQLIASRRNRHDLGRLADTLVETAERFRSKTRSPKTPALGR